MPSKTDLKYNKIIAAAKELFWKYGIKRVTIDEICKKGDVSKMTFYKHFRNKNDLVKILIVLIFDTNMDKYDSVMKSDLDFPDKVSRLILLKMEATNDISKEFLNDFYEQKDPLLLELFIKKKKESFDRLQSDFTNARKNGEIRKEIKPEFIMYILDRMVEMSNDPRLIEMYKSAQDLIMELTTLFFYGILPQSNKE